MPESLPSLLLRIGGVAAETLRAPANFIINHDEALESLAKFLNELLREHPGLHRHEAVGKAIVPYLKEHWERFLRLEGKVLVFHSFRAYCDSFEVISANALLLQISSLIDNLTEALKWDFNRFAHRIKASFDDEGFLVKELTLTKDEKEVLSNTCVNQSLLVDKDAFLRYLTDIYKGSQAYEHKAFKRVLTRWYYSLPKTYLEAIGMPQGYFDIQRFLESNHT